MNTISLVMHTISKATHASFAFGLHPLSFACSVLCFLQYSFPAWSLPSNIIHLILTNILVWIAHIMGSAESCSIVRLMLKIAIFLCSPNLSRRDGSHSRKNLLTCLLIMSNIVNGISYTQRNSKNFVKTPYAHTRTQLLCPTAVTHDSLARTLSSVYYMKFYHLENIFAI